MQRTIVIIALATLTGGCRAFGLGDTGVEFPPAGQYALVAINGNALPCCGTTDTTGVTTAIIGGSLTLANAAPEKFAATPGGIVPSKCVHEVPNWAHIDQNGDVTLLDGTTYHIPSCAELHSADYHLVLEHGQSGGGSSTSEVLSGTYAWGAWSANSPAQITLINAGMTGSFSTTSGTVEVRVQRSHFGMPTSDPLYTFRRNR